MIENFNELFSVLVLAIIIIAFIALAIRSSLRALERRRIKRELEYYQKRKEEQM